VTLVPNPNWSGTEPGLQEVKIQFLETGFLQYQDDTVDLTRIGAQDIVAAESAGLDDDILILPTGRITSVEMQMEDETLSDFNVRLALSRAIDRDQLNEVVYDGTNTPATYWVVKGLTGHQGNEAFDDIIGFNADAAKQALADAGFAGGNGFPELGVIIRDTPENRNLGDYLVKTWQDTLGITVVPEYLTGPAGPARFNAEDFDMFIGGWGLDYPDIENPLRGLFDVGGGQNKYNCNDPEVEAAFADAAAATTEEERIDAYMRVETEVVTGLCGVAPIFQDSLPFLVDPRIGGMTPNGTIDAGLPGNWCIECWYVKAD
jgi:oligopeptide transport system substrate-binding protein